VAAPAARRRGRGRMRRLAGGVIAWLAVLAAGGAIAQAPPQVTAPGGEVPPVPSGEGTIRGSIVLPGDPSAGADLPVALYALRPNGQPGLSGSHTDADGRFVFENVSTDASTVYLVGTQYREVPFGHRVTFQEGQRAVDVEVSLRRISDDASSVLVVSSVYKLDWVGSQLFVQVSHQIRQPVDTVVFTPEAERSDARPPLTARLPEDVAEFIDGQGGLGAGLERAGEELRYWGPVYPGDQEVRYGFLVDGPAAGGDPEAAQADRALELSWVLPDGSGEVQILTPDGDARPLAQGLRELDERSELDGVSYVRSTLGGVSPGGLVALALPIPASSTDATSLSIARADYWIDVDDTAMRVTAELNLEVDGASRLLADGETALLNFPFPDGAEFLGLSGAAQSIGVAPGPDGGLVVRGPLPPGRSVMGFRYQAPMRNGAARLDLDFDRPVGLLNVLVADSGVIVESERLHKRRPFRSGTRLYLHREAYQIAAGEPVPIELVPFERGEMPRALSTGIALAVAAAAAAYLVVPLRRARQAGERRDPLVSEWAVEREAVYDALRDLEHDHETGKVDDADYARMQGELRASAVELMRREQQSSAPAEAAAATCPGCGARTGPGWRFCSECGAHLEAPEDSA